MEQEQKDLKPLTVLELREAMGKAELGDGAEVYVQDGGLHPVVLATRGYRAYDSAPILVLSVGDPTPEPEDEEEPVVPARKTRARKTPIKARKR
jgi:hypothetical protein